MIFAFKIISEYSLWLIIPCFFIGVLISLLLYYKNKKTENLNNKLQIILAFSRFLLISFLCFLLLKPIFKAKFKTIEKPLIIIGIDNSQSILANKDSLFYKNEYPQKIDSLIDNLSDKFNVISYSFDSKINDSLNYLFNGTETNYSAFFDEVKSSFFKKNISSIILVSDGIFNSGSHPNSTIESFNLPILTIALGDTVNYRDFIIKNVNHNEISYLDNNFPVEVIIEAKKLKGEKAIVSVINNNTVIEKQIINISKENQFEKINFLIKAKNKGIQKYSIKINEVNDEINFKNNYTDFFIDILENKQKILIAYSSPHPDLSAIKQAIDANKNYEVDINSIDNINNYNNYDLIILHSSPTNSNVNIVNKIKESETPLLLINGTNTNINSFNNCNLGIRINQKSQNFNEVTANYNSNFSLFTISENTLKTIITFPPLICHFGEYQYNIPMNNFLNQKIGMVKTENPLITFGEINNKKVGFILGEGLYKWKLYDYKINKNFDSFYEIINKIVQFLSIKADRSYFRVKCNNVFSQAEQVIINAELYNESYELINEPDVKITITDKNQKNYNFIFNKTTNSYMLNVGNLPVGDYNYVCTVNNKNKIYSKKGTFSITQIKTEFINTVADHNLLNNLSVKTDGKLFYLNSKNNELNKLKNYINEDNLFKSYSYFKNIYADLINYKWILFLLVLLVTIEWSIRKINGVD